MKNFIQHGDIVTVTAAATTAAGAVVRVKGLIGVATHDAASGAPLEIKTTGVYDLAKTSAQAWEVGDPIYAVAATGVATNVAGTGNYLIGVALAAAANPSATGRVRLNGSLGHAVTA